MEELASQIKELGSQVDKVLGSADFDKKIKQQLLYQKQMLTSDFWSQAQAQDISRQAGGLEQFINNWQDLKKSLDELLHFAQDEQASSMQAEIIENYQILLKKYNHLSTSLFLSGTHDQEPAIITIMAGAGGVDAQDWAEMLERMYLRFAEQNNYAIKYLNRSPGNEAGLKSATFKVSGDYAFGYLKNEAGVHRLVRLSEYDADHARHTSFAMVEVLPEIPLNKVHLNETDLKIETYRASGHGGQSVNTTDSAVRITHLPTGLIVTCQNERSQLQNKNQALSYLASKLEQFQEAKREEDRRALKGEYTEAAWGNQIRSYVLHPYKLVKDHRTDLESTDPSRVLAGDLWPFIEAKLKQLASK